MSIDTFLWLIIIYLFGPICLAIIGILFIAIMMFFVMRNDGTPQKRGER